MTSTPPLNPHLASALYLLVDAERFMAIGPTALQDEHRRYAENVRQAIVQLERYVETSNNQQGLTRQGRKVLSGFKSPTLPHGPTPAS